ncbi:MAG: hypothetical protein H0T83_00920 [Chthoniobacterales bacterium]|nr:hypothetical protein [Chthoniobacterales bacterium]
MPKKFNKDQIQKIILSTLGFIGLIYCYFNFFLGPLNKSREAMTASIADVDSKTASSKAEMRKTANLEMQAKEATGRYEALKRTTADGAPIAWFPPKMRTFFSDRSIDKVTARLESSGDFSEPELSDWTKDTWAVELPATGYSDLGKAIAELENSEPLLAIQRVTIHAVPEEPQFQQVSLSALTALLKK